MAQFDSQLSCDVEMTAPLTIPRAEFDVPTQKAAWRRCKGNCEAEWCGLPIEPERPHYHHIIEAMLKPDNSLENCQVLHVRCHKIITSGRAKPLAKVRRIVNKRAGIKPKSRPMAGTRASGLKKKINGQVERRA